VYILCTTAETAEERKRQKKKEQQAAAAEAAGEQEQQQEQQQQATPRRSEAGSPRWEVCLMFHVVVCLAFMMQLYRRCVGGNADCSAVH
jgi:hypothetical protein